VYAQEEAALRNSATAVCYTVRSNIAVCDDYHKHKRYLHVQAALVLQVTQGCYPATAAVAAVRQRSTAECTAAHLAVAHAAVNTCLLLQSASSEMAVCYSVSGAVHLCVAAEIMLYTCEC
jgi:hypothetical protein